MVTLSEPQPTKDQKDFIIIIISSSSSNSRAAEQQQQQQQQQQQLYNLFAKSGGVVAPSGRVRALVKGFMRFHCRNRHHHRHRCCHRRSTSATTNINTVTVFLVLESEGGPSSKMQKVSGKWRRFLHLILLIKQVTKSTLGRHLSQLVQTLIYDPVVGGSSHLSYRW